jgi:hypothetical protein
MQAYNYNIILIIIFGFETLIGFAYLFLLLLINRYLYKYNSSIFKNYNSIILIDSCYKIIKFIYKFIKNKCFL